MRRALTARTTLDQLRKEAKRWLKGLRAGEPDARERLQAVWPDAPANPALRDIQHALALEHGEAGWMGLKNALEDLALDRNTYAERVEQVLRHGWDGDVTVARRILARYPQIARDSVFTAAACGELDEVERALAADLRCALSTGGSLGWSALAYVTYSRLDPVNAVCIARCLLAAGADPNFSFGGGSSAFTVLAGALRHGDGGRPSHLHALQLAELLTGAGAHAFDPQALNYISNQGADTVEPLELLWRRCEAQGELGQWRSLVEDGLGCGCQLTMLDYLLGNATGTRQLARCAWLLDRGADPDALHAGTQQPMHALAQLSGFLDIQHLLEERGAHRVALTGANGFRAACLRHDETAARALLAAEPQIIHDPAPLLAAAELGQADAIQLLLALGTDVNALDEDGISALHRAVQSGHPAAVDQLLAAGADPNVRERRWRGTPLSWAVVLGRPALYERLIPVSRDVRALACIGAFDRLKAVLDAEPSRANERITGDECPTPLFCLPEDEDRAVQAVSILLAHGADPTVENAQGRTPAVVARSLGLDDAAELMEKACAGQRDAPDP